MSYLAPIHHPSSVKHAVKLQLRSPDETCLVLAKGNRLELWHEQNESYVLLHTQSILGGVLMLDSFRPVTSTTDHLFVGTDRSMYFSASWDAEQKRLKTETSYVDLADKTSRDSQTQDRCIKDPTNRFMALFLLDGIVNIIPLSSKTNSKREVPVLEALGEPAPARISDIFIRSAAFLTVKAGQKHPSQMAILFEDSRQRICLNFRGLDYTHGKSGELGIADLEEELLGSRNDLELGSSHLLPLRIAPFGVLVLAETSLSYYSNDLQEEPMIEPLDEPAQFVTWTAIDDVRWLLADEYGRLYLLMLEVQNDSLAGWKMDELGYTSRASVLVYLQAGCVFVGSHQGDSQIVRIQQKGLEILQTMPNIAPILDFTVMDMGNRSNEAQGSGYSTGQARIVTGSGVFQDGSLRSVRSGVGLEELGVLGDVDNAISLFSLRASRDPIYHDVLVVSFVDETRIFAFSNEGDVEEQASHKNLCLAESSLLVTSTNRDQILQVTPSRVRLVDNESGMIVSEWLETAGQPITAASSSQDRLVICLGGSVLISFDIIEGARERARRTFDQGLISCISIPQAGPDFCFVGFWQGSNVAVIQAISLEILKVDKMSLDDGAIPRSLLLANMIQVEGRDIPTLLISMANGEVCTMDFDSENMTFTSKKVTALGTEQVNLAAIPGADGMTNVFAICEHPSLIFGSQGHLIFSAVSAEKATCVCPFNSSLYPKGIVIATADDLRIVSIDTERTTHLQTLHVGELVRRIAYSPSLKAFGMGTIHRSLNGNQEVVKSRFKLSDEIKFQELDTFNLNDEELVESVIRAELQDAEEGIVERFIVGTTYMDEDQADAVRGRILVFSVTSERALRLVTELPVKGACRALGCLHGKIVAALVKTVVVYEFRSSRLQKLCSYRTSTAPIDLAIHAPTSQVAVADLMKSVSILTFYPPDLEESGGSDNYKLEETARHFQTAWSTAVARVGQDLWLESDAEGNLIVLFQDKKALSDDDKRRLKVVGEIRLGEMVNRIRPVNVAISSSNHVQTSQEVTGASSTFNVVTPQAFMATVEGGVYLFGTIAASHVDIMMRLQAVLAPLVESLGNLPYGSYRAFRNQVREEVEPERFVDGELLESFLSLPITVQESLVEDLGEAAEQKGGIDGVREMVESLRRLH